jgi:hypothetical protein
MLAISFDLSAGLSVPEKRKARRQPSIEIIYFQSVLEFVCLDVLSLLFFSTGIPAMQIELMRLRQHFLFHHNSTVVVKFTFMPKATMGQVVFTCCWANC